LPVIPALNERPLSDIGRNTRLNEND